MKEYYPSLEQLNTSKKLFEENEPRDLFYKVANELVELSIQKKTSLTLTEAIAVLLQTWNKSYYRYKKFNFIHFQEIDSLLNENIDEVIKFRTMSIEDFNENGIKSIENLFTKFELVLGPVGASKTLHLLTPEFFPIWDREITKSYGYYLKKRGYNGHYYT